MTSAAFLTAASALLAQQATTAAPQTAVPQNDIPRLQAQLYDPQSKDDAREQAASRLLVRPDPAARDILKGALMAYNQPAVQRAAVRALALNPTPDPGLVTSLFALLDPSSDDRTIADAARGLTPFKNQPDVLPRLLNLASAGPDERIRVAAVDALGTFVDKRVAETLINLMSPTDSPRINAHAGDALAAMTSVDIAPSNLAAWKSWYDGFKNASNTDFQAAMLQSRSLRFDRLRTTETLLQDELVSQFRDRYQKASREERPELLLRLMRSGEPLVRLVGCQLAQEAAENDASLAAPIKAQLRDLVADASPDVRRRAASSLALINDAEALTPLLMQLGQESDSSVRAAIANALRPIRDIRSVRPLMVVLDDPAIATAQAAAEALGERELGVQIFQTDRALADELAEKLRQEIATRTAPQNNIELRYSLILALVPLKNALLEREMNVMLNSPAEAPKVRRALLAAAGEYKKPQFADAIAARMGDPDREVRLAAIQALGQSADSFGDFEKRLYDRIDPNVEQSKDVRDAAWTVLTKLFAKAPPEQLGSWELRLKNDPAKLLALLKEQRERAKKKNDPADVAYRNEQIGANSARIGQWDDAIQAYSDALKFAQDNKKPASIEILGEGLAGAYLGAKQYKTAVDFIQQQIRSDPSLEGTLGPTLRKEAERLATAGDFNLANQLIDLALAMDPPLKRSFTQGLRELQADMQRKSNEHNLSPYHDLDGLLNAMAARVVAFFS